VAEAADILGVSVEAVRRRIKRGKLDHECTDEGVFVFLDEDRPRPNDGRSVDRPQADSVAIISAKDETIAILREQLEHANARDRENRRIIAGLVRHAFAVALVQKSAAPPKPAAAGEESVESRTPVSEGAQVGVEPQSAPTTTTTRERIGSWTSVGIAVLLAGTLPLVLTVVVMGILWEAGHPASKIGIFFLYLTFHTLPLFFGIWAGIVRPGARLRGAISLALLVGAIEIAALSLFFFVPPIPHALGPGKIEVDPGAANVLGLAATIVLFTSGVLFAEIIRWIRTPQAKRPPGAWATLLIQAFGGTCIGIAGNVVVALITAATPPI
jgi:hypothetical protein